MEGGGFWGGRWICACALLNWDLKGCVAVCRGEGVLRLAGALWGGGQSSCVCCPGSGLAPLSSYLGCCHCLLRPGPSCCHCLPPVRTCQPSDSLLRTLPVLQVARPSPP